MIQKCDPMGQFLTTAEKFAKLRKWQAESWQEYGSKIERAQETLIGEQKVRPTDRQKFSAIKKQFIKGATFLSEEMKLIMSTCQDMQALVETAEQDQERREAIRKQRNMKDGFARMQVARPIQGLSAVPPLRQKQNSTNEGVQQAEAFMAHQGYQNKGYRPPKPQRISLPEDIERAPTEADDDRAADWFCRVCRTYEKHNQINCPNHDYCSICQREGHSNRFHNREMVRAEEQE